MPAVHTAAELLSTGWVQVPHWVWLAWVPQLLSGLQRPEAYYCKRILQELSRLFPQVHRPSSSVYRYPLIKP